MNRPTPKVDERQRVSLDFGARVTTPDGFGLYVNRDADSIDHHEGHHWVLLKAWPRQQRKYHWSQMFYLNLFHIWKHIQNWLRWLGVFLLEIQVLIY